MTRDDIIEAASKAGFETKRDMIWVDQWEITPTLTRFALLVRDQMLSKGWRQCAKGQRTTQFCGMVEQARAEERERLASAIDHQRRAMKDHFEVQWLRELAAALRARHPEPDDANPSF